MSQTLKEKIIDVVKASTSIDKKTISETTSTKGIVLERALSKLIKDKILVVEVKDEEKTYSIAPEIIQEDTAEASFPQMRIDLESEKRATQSIWKKREKQIEKVTINTIEMHSSIKGIAGNAIQSVKLLELPEPKNDTDELE